MKHPRSSSYWLSAHTLLAYLFLYAPIVVLITFSFNAAKQVTLWRGFSTQWYVALFSEDHLGLREAATTSLIVAAIATSISTVIGTLGAIALSRYRFRGRGVTGALLYLPVIIPDIVLGVSLLVFFHGVGVEEMGLTTIVIAHVVFTVSYITVIVKARLSGLDPTLEEAARDLGATPLGAFVRVTLPRMLPGVVAAALLAFTLSLDDYVITSLVSGMGSETLPIKVYSLLRPASVTPEINAACTILLAITMALIVTAQRLLQR